MDMDFWLRVLETRAAVSKQLEILRVENRIGSSLDAEVTLYCDSELRGLLQRLGDELRFIMITSEVDVAGLEDSSDSCAEATLASGARVRIDARPSSHTKCVRCWHHRADVGADQNHPELCGRCVENVAGAGESRRFA